MASWDINKGIGRTVEFKDHLIRDAHIARH